LAWNSAPWVYSGMPNLAVIGEGDWVFENLLKHRGTATGSA